jgi:hypothetical protein
VVRYSRKDVEALVKRLEDRISVFELDRQPQLARDLRAAAAIVKGALAAGLDAVEVAND